ncbi:hypothetical protein EKL32_07505 [Flavobacterium sp. GSN2]|nr:hypothetical protein EKL32_07505 [Flavobacterium sp. GSN2]
MKKVMIINLVLVSLLVSCKKDKAAEIIPENETSVIVRPISECYVGVLERDTISLTISINKNKVAGELSYKFFEKDSNSGIISGTMKGNTLIAEYTFQSEGQTSIRQVAFLKKGNTFIEGYGDVMDDNGKTKFRDTKQLHFDGKPLSKVECKM